MITLEIGAMGTLGDVCVVKAACACTRGSGSTKRIEMLIGLSRC